MTHTKKLLESLLFIIIILFLTSCPGQSKIIGNWVFCDSNYLPVQNKVYNDYQMIIIEKEYIYMGYLNSFDNNDFKWISSNLYNINTYTLKSSSFKIKYKGSNKEEKYSFILLNENEAECIISTQVPGQDKTERVFYIKRVEKIDNTGKLVAEKATPDVYDSLDKKNNDTIENSIKLDIKQLKYNLSFHHDDDVDWFHFDAIANNTYNFNTSPYSSSRTALSCKDTIIELYEINKITGKLQISKSHDDNIANPNDKFAKLLWRCQTTGTYYLKIYPKKRLDNKDITGRYELEFTEEKLMNATNDFKRHIPIANKKNK